MAKKKAHVMKLSELELELVKAAKGIAQEVIPVSILSLIHISEPTRPY